MRSQAHESDGSTPDFGVSDHPVVELTAYRRFKEEKATHLDDRS